jgi:hypothetical protein
VRGSDVSIRCVRSSRGSPPRGQNADRQPSHVCMSRRAVPQWLSNGEARQWGATGTEAMVCSRSRAVDICIVE